MKRKKKKTSKNVHHNEYNKLVNQIDSLVRVEEIINIVKIHCVEQQLVYLHLQPNESIKEPSVVDWVNFRRRTRRRNKFIKAMNPTALQHLLHTSADTNAMLQ